MMFAQNLILVNWQLLRYFLSSLFKSNLYKTYPKLTKCVKKELKINKLKFQQKLKLPNRTKYFLYRLGLLNGAFQLQHILKK